MVNIGKYTIHGLYMDGMGVVFFQQKTTGTKRSKTEELLGNFIVKLKTNEPMDFVSCFIDS